MKLVFCGSVPSVRSNKLAVKPCASAKGPDVVISVKQGSRTYTQSLDTWTVLNEVPVR